MKTWDVIVVGGGIIGLSLSLALRKRGATVLVVERGEPGREASYAAAGMLADCEEGLPAAVKTLAVESALLHPEFAHELQDESGASVDLRAQGTIFLEAPHNGSSQAGSLVLSDLEPGLAAGGLAASHLPERSVDPRALAEAALKAARHRGVDISSGTAVTGILISGGKATGVKTARTEYHAAVVVNCAGAWTGQIPPYNFPVRPVKGQILAVLGAPAIQHVIRGPEVYLVPRSDGRLVIGATVEEAGYDKRTDPDAIQQLLHAAAKLVPGVGQARLHEAWAGLRPATGDDLPILGETTTAGYFVASGHFRDGILLAPVTARIMSELIAEKKSSYDLSAFSPGRFDVAHSDVQRAV